MINPNTNDVSHWFFKNWAEANVNVIHPTRGLVRWTQHSFHDTLAEAMDVHRFVVVNKFRQAGISTMCVAHGLWEAIWTTDKRIVFLSKTDREARYLSQYMRTMIEHMPDQQFGKVVPVKQNDHEVTFESGSTVNFWGVSYAKAKAVDHLYIDEAAFIPKMEEYWQAFFPCLCNGGKCTVVSTPNGAEGWYYDLMNGAVKGKNSFHPVRLSWRDHPDYNSPEWEAQILENLGPKGFLQEIVGCFLTPQHKEKLMFKTSWDKLDEKEQQVQKVLSEYDLRIKKLEQLEALKIQIIANNPELLRTND